MAVITGPEGKTFLTEGKGRGKVMWKDLASTASVVTVSPKGIVSHSKDPRVSDGKLPHLIITVPSHPEIHTEHDIPLRYNRAYNSNFSGSSSLDGSSGSSGSIDPDNPSAGGNGSDGSSGSDGHDGGPRGDAPPVQIWAAFRPGNTPLIQVRVSGGSREELFLLDPYGGP